MAAPSVPGDRSRLVVRVVREAGGGWSDCNVDVPRLDNGCRVTELQLAVAAATGVPAAHQVLLFGGRRLDPARAVNEYGLLAGSTLHVIVAPEGGAFDQGTGGGMVAAAAPKFEADTPPDAKGSPKDDPPAPASSPPLAAAAADRQSAAPTACHKSAPPAEDNQTKGGADCADRVDFKGTLAPAPCKSENDASEDARGCPPATPPAPSPQAEKQAAPGPPPSADGSATGLIFAVLGCGHLGQRVAFELASQGVTVYVYDRSIPPDKVRGVVSGLRGEVLDVGGDSGTLLYGKADAFLAATLGRIHGVASIGEAVARAGVVSECVADNLDIKQQVISEIERHCSPWCLITTNTLTISLASMREGTQRPHNIVGLRFLWPVLFIPFVEISVPAEQESACDQLRATLQSLGKLCFDAALGCEAEPNSMHDSQTRRLAAGHRFRLLEREAMRYQCNEARVRFASADVGYQPASECIVCYDGPCEALIVACGHRVLCMSCASQLVQTRQNCPLCRASMNGRTVRVSDLGSGFKPEQP